MLEIDISDESHRFLTTLSKKHERQLVRKIQKIAENPKTPQAKSLEGFHPLCCLRSGEYRIVFWIDGQVLRVPLIDRRNDDRIYRRLKQIFG